MLRSIQLPQALTAMLPALVGQLVVILKDSALGTAITYPELLQQGQDVGTAYAAVIPAYVVAALLFIVINYGLTVLAGRVERRINRRGRAAGGTITNAMPGAPGGSGAMASTGAGRRQRAEPRPAGPDRPARTRKGPDRVVRALPRGVLPRLDSNQQPAD